MTKLPRFVCSNRLLLPLVLCIGSLACKASEENSGGTGARPTSPEAMSLLGEPLYAREDHEGNIAKADALLAQKPNELAILLVAANVRADLWRYREAIEMYTRGVQMAPDDWRSYRFRGHRYISLREFDKAIVDLEKARELAPHSLDVAYHLGVAYFLQGRFDEAANEYGRCMALSEDPDVASPDPSPVRSCAQVADDVASWVAMTDWRYRSLRRAGRHTEARALLDGVSADWQIAGNTEYYIVLLFYKGLRSEQEILAPENLWEHRFETVAYGVANWHMAEGNTARAKELLQQIVQDPQWPGFGRIAAEADLTRMAAVAQ